MTTSEAMEILDEAMKKTRNEAAKEAWRHLKIEIISAGLDSEPKRPHLAVVK